jgi:RNA polymerase sigma factor (sigma-70 family)
MPRQRNFAQSQLCHTLLMTGVSDDRARWLAEHVVPCESGLRAWLARRRVVDLDVDDIVQEAYAVLAELETVTHIRNPRTYLYSVAHSIILQHVRRLRIVSIETMAEVDRLGIYSEEPTPEEALSDFQELRSIARMVAALPRKCGEAFVLRKVEGLSQREVAERMRISESTVEKHIGKAIRLLMGVLTGESETGPRAGAATQRSTSQPRSCEQSDE